MRKLSRIAACTIMLAASPVSAFAQATVGGSAIVKPIDPIDPAEALRTPADLKGVELRLASNLSKDIDTLDARAKDVAACAATVQSDPKSVGATGGYYECIAGAAGGSRAAWDDVRKAFLEFRDDLAKLEQRMASVKKAQADVTARKQGEITALKAGAAAGIGKLKQIAVQVKAGALSRDDEVKVRKLIDDVRAAHWKIVVTEQGMRKHTQVLARLDQYADRVSAARRSADVLAHQAENRVDVWSNVIDNVLSIAEPTVLGNGFSAEDLGQVSALVGRLPANDQQFAEIFNKDLGESGGETEVPLIVPDSGSLADELDKLVNDDAPMAKAN